MADEEKILIEEPEYIEEDIESEEIEDDIEDSAVVDSDDVIDEYAEVEDDEDIIECIEVEEPETETAKDDIVDTTSLAVQDTAIKESAPTITENILAEPIDKVGRDEVTAVENVFRIMFGGKQTNNVPHEEPVAESQNDEYNEIYSIVEDEEPQYIEEVIEAEEFEEITEDEIAESEKITLDEEFEAEEFVEYIDTSADLDVPEAPYPPICDDSADNEEEFFDAPEPEYFEDDIEDIPYNYEEDDYDIYDSDEDGIALEYSYDPLQGHLSDAAYLVHKSVDEKLEFKSEQRDIDLDDDDISLLLDFGYDEEIKSEAGAGRTNQIKRKKKSEFIPEKSDRIYGYSGEEYMGHSDDKSVKSKYISDKKKIIAKIAILSVLAIVMLGISILYHADAYIDKNIYPYAELIAMAITAIVAYSGLIEGARGIAKLDPKNYSIPAFLMIIQVIYDVFIIALQSNSGVDSEGKMISCGFIVIIYVLAALISDALECSAEMATFDVISTDARLYSAEKFNKPKNDTNDKNGARGVSSNVMLGNCIYKVKETDIAHGYFSRMSKKSNRCLRVMYFMGILPVIALVMGCISLLSNGDTYVALTSVMTVILMGFPMSFTLFKAIPYFYTVKKLSSDKCAIVGDISSNEYALVDMIMFDDVDAVKVTESIEIRPEGNPDVATAIKVASRAFKALGGPLSRILATDPNEEDASINIVSIRDNGIEFYMDSYLHVVIGDKNFMSVHGMKVSSDSKIISPMSDNKATSVLYVAFNGVPQLGYIVSSKISDEFTRTVKELSSIGVKTAVATYSPVINDYYFEANKPVGVASTVIHKPAIFEPRDKTHFVDGGVFSIGESTKISGAFIEARKYLRFESQNKRFSTLMAILGILLGIISVVLTLASSNIMIGILSCVLILIFNAISVFGIIFKHLDLKSKMKSR